MMQTYGCTANAHVPRQDLTPCHNVGNTMLYAPDTGGHVVEQVFQVFIYNKQRSGYLQQVEVLFVHAGCHVGGAYRGIGCHMDALLIAPLHHSIIPPESMHLNLHTNGNRCLTCCAGCIRRVTVQYACRVAERD